jgi:hypothetical protein
MGGRTAFVRSLRDLNAAFLTAVAAETPDGAFVGLVLVPARGETFFCFAVTADCLSMISLLLK